MPHHPILFIVLSGAALVFSVVSSWSVAGRDAETWYRNLWRSLIRGPFAERELFTARGWRLRNLALILAALAVIVMLFF
jgi:hypothetical protein